MVSYRPRGPLYVLLALLVGSLAMAGRSQAQSVSSARINEVLIHNVDNYIDTYGHRSPWIEVYNASSGSINLAGCYLTDDPTDLRKYQIPSGDVRTLIKPRQSVIFFADAMPLRGPFHVNFTYRPDETNYLALVSNDGSTIIDEVEVPAHIPADHSYARLVDGVRQEIDRDAWGITEHTTPGANNLVTNGKERIDRLKAEDTNGIVMTITAMLVVFAALLLLFLCYKLIGQAVMAVEERQRRIYAPRPRREDATSSAQSGTSAPSMSDEVAVQVAIGLAIAQELEQVHDEDSMVLTFHPHSERNSAWSAKGQLLRQPLSPTIRR